MSQSPQSHGDGSEGLIDRVLACSSYQALEHDVLKPFTRLLDASSGVFVQFLGLPLDGDAIGHVRHVGVGRRAMDEYGEGLYSLDPMVQPALQWLHSANDTQRSAIGLLSEIDGWRDQPHYSRFLERFDIEHVLAVALMVRTVLGPQCLCFGFHRGRGQQPFAAADLRRLERYIPALTPVVSNLVHREVADLCGTMLATVAVPPNVPGYLVFDEDLRVRHASPEAIRRLRLDAQRTTRENALGELRRALLRAGSPGARLNAAPPIDAAGVLPGHDELDVRAVRWSDGSRAFIVMLNDEGGGDRSFDPTCQQFNLTSREREVARFVCRGLTTADVARQLGIAARTVENHLRSIYSKVGVSSRGRLIAQLLRLN